MGNCDFRSVQNEDKDVILDNHTNTKQPDNATKARSGVAHTYLNDDDEKVAKNEERNFVSNNKEDGPEQTPFDNVDANEKRQEVDEVIQSNSEPAHNHEIKDVPANENQEDSLVECNHDEFLQSNDYHKSKPAIKSEPIRKTITINQSDNKITI